MSDPKDAADATQWIFFAIAACIVMYQMASGWKRGVARQAVHLLALILSYIVAWTCAPRFVPLLRSLGYPDFVLSAIAGVGLALVVFLVVTLMGVVVFKKTSQQTVAFVRFAYGISGALLALVSGLVFVWMALMAVRLVGTVAQGEINASKAAASKVKDGEEANIPQPNAVVVGLANMKHSLEKGVAANVVKQVDPVPKKVYEIVDKMTAVVASPEEMKRFLDYPGAQTLVSNSKIAALRDDPDIIREIKAKNYLALLKNQHLIEVVNDPGLYPLLKKFELEKALDYSAASPQKEIPPATL